MRMSGTRSGFVTLGTAMVFYSVVAISTAHAELLLFYDFDDASNVDVAVDVSGNGNDGEIEGAEYTDGGGGRTGGAGDRALDFLEFNDSSVLRVPTAFDGAFDTMTDNDAGTVAFWLFGGESQPVNQWTFWFGPDRQLGSHAPWGDGTIYFDVAGLPGNCCGPTRRIQRHEPDDTLYKEEWNHYAMVKNEVETYLYQNGELIADFDDSDAEPGDKDPLGIITEASFGAHSSGSDSINGLMDDIGVWDTALTPEEIADIMMNGLSGETRLQAGDSNQDLNFNQVDLVQVQVAAKYLTGNPATWGEGDWDGAPGGTVGSPPPGDGAFNQLDIISALNAGTYLTGPYGAVAKHPAGDGNATLKYDPSSGELSVEVGAAELTSINIDSAGSIFTGDAAMNLGGSFDNDADNNIFKATFGSSFGSITFGNVAQTGLSEDFVLNDLTVIGSLAGGGDLGNVDLIYVPEPSTAVLLALSFIALVGYARRRR